MAAAQLMDLGYRVCRPCCWLWCVCLPTGGKIHNETRYMQVFMRRNSVYVAFIIGGALAGEKVSVVGHQLRCTHSAMT